MYLSVLTDEEKALFLGLAYDLATSDGDYSLEEQAIIASYSQEMQLEFDESSMKKPIDSIVKELNEKSDIRAKKIIVFEAIGLAMADKNYDDVEREIIAQIEATFGLAKGYGAECESVLNEYISFQNKINNLVLK